jgi:hypothetical protein
MKYLAVLILAMLMTACEELEGIPRSSTGVSKVTASVSTQANGLTIEQENVKHRIEMENQPGSMKFLYVISAMSGDIIIYSSVKGKVTSSGKRLTPTTVAQNLSGEYASTGFQIDINGKRMTTTEVLQDDGTYGSSIEYLFWWDTQDRYHQHYISGGQVVHISDAPIGARKSSTWTQ